MEQNFLSYMLENFKFISTIAFDTIPAVLGMIFLNLSGNNEIMGLLGFMISSFYFFCCLFFNHSEVINLKSGSHFSNGNFQEFSKNVAQTLVVNLMFYCVSLLVCSQCWYVFEFLGLKGDFLETVSHYVPIYCICVGTLFMLTNMVRGERP